MWTDHADETDAWWQAHAEGVETWAIPDAGYYELDRRGDDVEIAYFGLLPAFHGRGWGGALLEHALRRGFELGSRVWVHTCTLDGPHALANYEARGLVPYRRSRAKIFVTPTEICRSKEPHTTWPRPSASTSARRTRAWPSSRAASPP